MRFVTVLSILALTLVSAQVQAEEKEQTVRDTEEWMLFAEIPSVYGASKREQALTEAPASVTIVTAADITRFGYDSLAEILSGVTGFYVSDDRNYSYAGVRGFSRPGDFNSRVLVLIDGYRSNDVVFGAAYLGGAFAVPIELIDRVEVIRGPSSSLYGTSAFFAVINVITKSGRDFKGGEVLGAWSSLDAYQGSASYGERFSGGLEFLVSASISDAAGQDLFFEEFREINDGLAVGADYQRTRHFFGKLSWGDFDFFGSHVSRKKGIPTASYETVFNDPGTFTVDEATRIGLEFDRELAGFSVNNRVFFDRIIYRGDYRYDYADEGDPPDLVTFLDLADSHRWGNEVKLSRELGTHHRITFGGEYRHNFRIAQSNLDTEVYLNDNRSSHVMGLYVQDEIRLHDTLLINAGVRHDRYLADQVLNATSPRAALIYKPFEQTTFKLLYGHAFRAPSVYELYYHDGYLTQKPSSLLRPERMRTTEIAVEKNLGRYLLASVSLFHSSLRDLISLRTDQDELLVFDNIESVRARGIETSLDGRWENGVQLRLSYTHQQSQDTRQRALLTNSPRHTATARLSTPLFSRHLRVGLENLFVGGRKTLSGGRADAFLVTHLTLVSRDLRPGWNLSLSVRNLMDQKYGDPGSAEHLQDIIARDGRVLRIRVGYSFGSR